MKKYNIGANLSESSNTHVTRPAVQSIFKGSIGDWFPTTVGVQQGCLLLPTLFNMFLDRIITDALEDHEGTISIGGKTITNLHFADDIDG